MLPDLFEQTQELQEFDITSHLTQSLHSGKWNLEASGNLLGISIYFDEDRILQSVSSFLFFGRPSRLLNTHPIFDVYMISSFVSSLSLAS